MQFVYIILQWKSYFSKEHIPERTPQFMASVLNVSTKFFSPLSYTELNKFPILSQNILQFLQTITYEYVWGAVINKIGKNYIFDRWGKNKDITYHRNFIVKY
jgi:hypothetical protein